MEEKSDRGVDASLPRHLEVPAEDLLRLTEGVELVVEIEPATGSRLKGSYWVATIPTLGVTASALGLDQTIELLALEALGAADQVVSGDEDDREEKLPVALKVLALESLGRLQRELRAGEVVSEQFMEMVPPPDDAA